MRLSFFRMTRVRSRVPKKSLASIAAWLVVAPLLSLVAVTSSAVSASAADCVVGSSADCPLHQGASAKAYAFQRLTGTYH